MADKIFHTVMSPETGVRTGAGGPPPGMGPPPGAEPPPASPLAAERLDSLDGKTVYLVDTGFGGSYNFMLQLQKWFAAHLPSVTTVRKRKPGNVFMDDNDSLWEEVRQKGDAAVVGVAG